MMMMLESKVATESCVSREYSRRLITQSWGAAMIRMKIEEVCLPTLTIWVLREPCVGDGVVWRMCAMESSIDRLTEAVFGTEMRVDFLKHLGMTEPGTG